MAAQAADVVSRGSLSLPGPAMRVPAPPAVPTVAALTPTLYDAALKCSARAAWVAAGNASAVPAHPRALLGTGFHAVMQAARTGRLAEMSRESISKAAEVLFDERVRALFHAAHPLLRAKFAGPDRLPYYYLYRARAAQMGAASASPVRTGPPTGRPPTTEAWLESADRLIAGRPDHIDAMASTVIDYKTGGGDLSGQPSEADARQLRLYVFLALENGHAVDKAAVIRSDGSRSVFEVSASAATAESQRARTVLSALQALAGKPFQDAASPSEAACRFCPCIPFCERFWQAAESKWAGQVGVHVEGEITRVNGSELISLELDAACGTSKKGAAVVSRIARSWLTFDEPLPVAGEVVRITDASLVQGSDMHYRADRIMTAVWRVKQD